MSDAPGRTTLSGAVPARGGASDPSLIARLLAEQGGGWRAGDPVPVEAFKHEDKRVNIPTADSSELVSPDVAQPTQLRYPRNGG